MHENAYMPSIAIILHHIIHDLKNHKLFPVIVNAAMMNARPMHTCHAPCSLMTAIRDAKQLAAFSR